MAATSNSGISGFLDNLNLPAILVRIANAIGIVLTNPLASFYNSVNAYTQVGIQNKGGGTSSSSDFISYPDNNTNDVTGFVDMGVCSSTYADSSYTITGPNDAYLFGSAVASSGKNGNLVICTDSTGVTNDIVFGTNGFLVGNVRFRIKQGGAVNHVPLASAPTINVAEGDVYYNSTLHKLQVRGAAAWETITSV